MQPATRFPVPRFVQFLYIGLAAGPAVLLASAINHLLFYVNNPEMIDGEVLSFATSRLTLLVIVAIIFTVIYKLQSSTYGKLWRLFITSSAVVCIYILYIAISELDTMATWSASSRLLIPFAYGVLLSIAVWAIERMNNRLRAAQVTAIIMIVPPYLALIVLLLLNHYRGEFTISQTVFISLGLLVATFFLQTPHIELLSRLARAFYCLLLLPFIFLICAPLLSPSAVYILAAVYLAIVLACRLLDAKITRPKSFLTTPASPTKKLSRPATKKLSVAGGVIVVVALALFGATYIINHQKPVHTSVIRTSGGGIAGHGDGSEPVYYRAHLQKGDTVDYGMFTTTLVSFDTSGVTVQFTSKHDSEAKIGPGIEEYPTQIATIGYGTSYTYTSNIACCDMFSYEYRFKFTRQ